MDLASIIGTVVGVIIIVVVMIMDGGTPAELFAHPSALILIFGGAIAATTITTSLKTVLSLPKLLMQAFTTHKFEIAESIELLVRMADRARREGKIDVKNYRGSHYLMLQSERSGPVGLCEIPPARLLELMEEFNTGFYRRPAYLLERLLALRSPQEIGQLFWGAAMVFRRKLPLAWRLFGRRR